MMSVENLNLLFKWTISSQQIIYLFFVEKGLPL